jgi:uncharacterized protein
MAQLKRWQWAVLVMPIVVIAGFLLGAAGAQIHAWRINWIWAVVTLLLVGWRWLLVHWTKPLLNPAQVLAEVNAELANQTSLNPAEVNQQAEAILQTLLTQAQADLPIWEDWPTFWQRCQELVSAVAHLYYPEVKYPLLNIHIPQAYGLIRGTVDDMDLWMQKLSPVLSQVTLGQGYEAYEVYRKLEPSARKLWQAWNWASWVLNPVAAVARQASQPLTEQANQQLLVNLGQSLREATLRNLCRQAVLLYGQQVQLLDSPVSKIAAGPQTQTLRQILAEAKPVEALEQTPLNILLVGRTGAGKSSLINTLFQTDLATTDLLPNTDQIQRYQWQTETGPLILWDSPGYEQVNQKNLRQQVLDYACNGFPIQANQAKQDQAKQDQTKHGAELILLVTPALDPALQMDADFLKDLQAALPDLPTFALVTQVDRLRPAREWQPPYDWQWGNRPKEVAIRAAIAYRSELLGEYCDRVLPIVTSDQQSGRAAWGADALAVALMESVAPATQFRLARFLRDLDARSLAAAQIIDRYALQITATRDLTTWLKSPVLALIARQFRVAATTTPVWAAQIPVEQLPVAIGKLQMAYDLFTLFNSGGISNFNLRLFGPLLLDAEAPAERSTWALGQTLVQYWTTASAEPSSTEQLQASYQAFLKDR